MPTLYTSSDTVPDSEPRRLYQVDPAGRAAFTSPAARSEVERFAAKLRFSLGARCADIRVWPYRRAGATWWAFSAVGAEGSLRLTFVESGSTRFPLESPSDCTGEFADSVDAHHLLAFLERELSGTAADA